MSFWKKLFKKVSKVEKKDPKKLAEDKYLKKLKKKLKKHKWEKSAHIVAKGKTRGVFPSTVCIKTS